MMRKHLPLLLLALALAVAPSTLHAGANGDLLRAVSLEHAPKDNFLKRMMPELRRCLDAGADIHARNDAGRNAIHLLLEKHGGTLNDKALEVLRFLIEKGADVNAADCYGVTPLMIEEDLLRERKWFARSCRNCDNLLRRIESIETTIGILHGAGAARKTLPDPISRKGDELALPHIADESYPDGMLIGAIERGDHTAVRKALEKGACFDCFYFTKSPDSNQQLYTTPLRRATEKGDIDSVKMLLRHGADPNSFDVNIFNKLDKEPYREIVKLHIDAGMHFGGGMMLHPYTSAQIGEIREYLFRKWPALREEYELAARLRKTLGVPSQAFKIQDPDELFRVGTDVDVWERHVSPYLDRVGVENQWDLAERFIDAGIKPKYNMSSIYISYLMESKNPRKYEYFKKAVLRSQCAREVLSTMLHYYAAEDNKKRTAEYLRTIERMITLPVLTEGRVDVNSLAREHIDNNEYHEVSPLMFASYHGWDTLARLLIKNGARVTMKNGDGESALAFAVAGTKESTVKMLVDAGADVEPRNRYGTTPLMAACYRGHAGIAKLLVESGAAIGIRDTAGWTPLVYAAYSGSEALVAYLLEKGAEVNHHGKDGITPLIMALREGNGHVAKLLVARGAKRDGRHEKDLKNHFLLLAAGTGRTGLVKKLIGEGAEINYLDYYGRTPLFLAAMNGHLETARALVGAGADVKKQCLDGSAPLHAFIGKTMKISRAWYRNDPYPHDERINREMIDLLIGAGADMKAVDMKGRSPLNVALSKYRVSTYLVKRLIRAGADINRPDNRGMTPLMNVAGVDAMGFYEYGAAPDELIDALLNAGARVNDATHNGVTSLMLFVHTGRMNGVARLFRAGADPGMKTKSGLTAVDFARRPNMIHYLVSRGAAPTDRSYKLMGWHELRKNNYSAAKMYFSKALNLRQDAGLYNDLGFTCLRMREYRQAESHLRKALEKDPNYPLPYYNMACLFSRQGKVTKALDWLGRGVDKGFRERAYLLFDRDLEKARKNALFRVIMKKLD